MESSAEVAQGLIGSNSGRGDQTLSHTTSGVARHATLMVGSTVLVAVLNYALNIILGWALPVEEYGRVGVSQTLIFICVWFLSAGFPWVVTRAIAQERNSESPVTNFESSSHPISEEGHAWRVYKTAWVANTLLSAVVVALLVVAFGWRWLPLEAAYGPLIIMVAITVGALGIGSVSNAGLQGLLRFERISAVRIIEAVANILVSITLVVLGFGAAGALGGFAVSAVVVCLLNIWFMRDRHFWHTKGWGGFGTVRAALPMTLAVFGGVLLSNIDLLAVKFLSEQGTSDLLSGGYQVAAVLARAPLFIGTALVSTFYPRIAQEAGGPNEGRAARELLRWLAVGVLPLNTILVVGAPAVVLFFFPQQYAGSAPILSILGLGSAGLVVAGALAAILQGLHRASLPAMVMSLAVALQLVGLAWLVPANGAMGAASASALASILACVLLLWYCARLGVFPHRTGRQVIALLVLGLLIVPLAVFFAGTNRIFVAAWVSAALTLYMAICFILNLIDANGLQVPARLQSGAIGTMIHRLLTVGRALNRIGR